MESRRYKFLQILNEQSISLKNSEDFPCAAVFPTNKESEDIKWPCTHPGKQLKGKTPLPYDYKTKAQTILSFSLTCLLCISFDFFFTAVKE